MRILSVRGVPTPLYGQNFRQKKVTDLGGTPLPPFTDIFPKNVLQKVLLKIVFFAQKTPDFGPKNRLGIGGVPVWRFPSTCLWMKTREGSQAALIFRTPFTGYSRSQIWKGTDVVDAFSVLNVRSVHKCVTNKLTF